MANPFASREDSTQTPHDISLPAGKVRDVARSDNSHLVPPYTPPAEHYLSREQSSHGYFPPQKPAPPTGGTPLRQTPHEAIPDGIEHHDTPTSAVPAELSEEKHHKIYHLHFKQRIKHFTWTWFTMTVSAFTRKMILYCFLLTLTTDGYRRNCKCHALQ